jgi:hypothetical protein
MQNFMELNCLARRVANFFRATKFFGIYSWNYNKLIYTRAEADALLIYSAATNLDN